ncbi:lysylphosphatidylglycerol synthase domain-containing protein [Spirillospora sp. NPDC047279]|uniref:lysylphosphatidylglycerol synthase domain-containing protein n=1 Tax=Spirillospora sp. NPDC047279 TaxID=3155478 RepID=UPI0033F86AEC
MSRRTRIALSAVSLIGAAALLVALPYVVGVDWEEIFAEIGRLSAVEVTVLTLLWLAGLGAYTYVLAASLPGLTHVHGFMLNAVGSAVSNLLPFGGAAGVAVTFAMARGWGHRNAAIAVSTLVTGVWNVLSRLLLPAVGIVALLVAGELPDKRMAGMAGFAAAALLGIVVLLALVLRSEAAARTVDRWMHALALRLPSRPRSVMLRADGAMLDVRNKTVGVLRTGWKGLTFGMAAYLLLQALLLEGCLVVVGAEVELAEVVAVFAINRMLTTAVITPSGAGISETGTAALLVHFGVPAAPAAAATILYSFYTYAIEMPTGGLAWAGWTLRRRRDRGGDGATTPHRTLVKK